MANNNENFEELSPEEAQQARIGSVEEAVDKKHEKILTGVSSGLENVDKAMDAAKTSDETADEQAARFKKEDARAKATTKAQKTAKKTAVKTGSGSVTESLPDEGEAAPLSSLQEAADAGAPLTEGASRILLGGGSGSGEIEGRHNRAIQSAIDELEPYDFENAADAEKWRSTMDQKISDAAAMAGGEKRVAVSTLPAMQSNAEPGQEEAETLSKGRNLPQTVTQEQIGLQRGTKLEGLAQQAVAVGSSIGRSADRNGVRAAQVRGTTRTVTPTLLRDYAAVTGIRHKAFMGLRKLVEHRATVSALASLMQRHESTPCDNAACQADMAKVDATDLIQKTAKTRNAPRTVKVTDADGIETKKSIFRSTGERYKKRLAVFAKHHGDDSSTQAEVAVAIDKAHIRHKTRYDTNAPRTGQPANSDWQETPNSDQSITEWAEHPSNKHILEKVALARHLNEFVNHPLFGGLVDKTTHPELFGEGKPHISVEEVVRAISAHKGYKSAHPELIDEDHAIAVPQSMPHQAAVAGMNGLARDSYNAFIDVPNRVADIYGSTGKNTNVSGVTQPWGKGEKEAAAEKTKITGFDKHVAWAADSLALLGHINSMRQLGVQRAVLGRQKARDKKNGVDSDTPPGAMPAEGHARPSQVPGARRTSTIDLADRLVNIAKSIAESSGTTVQDGGPSDEYGTRPRDLIAGDVASAAGQQRVRLGLPAKTAAEISPKIAAVASNPAAISSIIPKGEPGLDYIPGQGRDGAQGTMVDSGVRNVDAAKTRKTRESIIAERDKALEPIMARVAVHNATRADNNQKPHALPQALAHLGLTKQHADIHATANSAIAALGTPD